VLGLTDWRVEKIGKVRSIRPAAMSGTIDSATSDGDRDAGGDGAAERSSAASQATDVRVAREDSAGTRPKATLDMMVNPAAHSITTQSMAISD
jgi:hypothetical protein